MKHSKGRLSIIIPTLNEAGNIESLLLYLQQYSKRDNIREILVVDGHSDDGTAVLAMKMGARVIRSNRGRAVQMNVAARHADGDIFYFLHADTYPPPRFDELIINSADRGHGAGCFRMRFDSRSLFLQFFSWFSRFNYRICRGGDQSLFVTRELFESSHGFDESFRIYEDNEYVSRLYRMTRFKVLPQHVVTSARRYRQKHMLSVQFHFAIMHIKRWFGAGPDDLHRYYSKNIAV